MKTIAISKWIGYCPFREAVPALAELDVQLLDGVHDRVEGLADGRYSAAPLSTYELVEALPQLGDQFKVAWIAVMPEGAGSDRIICRSDIASARELHGARIGVREKGLERLYFEHIFAKDDLPPKKDYILLRDRDAYADAFRRGSIEAVMAPQPLRSELLREPDTLLYVADDDLPRHGFYAPLVYAISSWQGSELRTVQRAFLQAGARLRQHDDVVLWQLHKKSIAGIPKPALEIHQTIRWPSEDESMRYLASEGMNSFHAHLENVAELVADRMPQTSTVSKDSLLQLAARCSASAAGHASNSMRVS